MPANHQDDAVNADTDALVTELIAFVDDNQDAAMRALVARVASVQSDPMASVLH